MSEWWIGTSGYVYPHWRRGVFYPNGLRQKDELGWYATQFRTVELNNPFYRLPEPESFDRWHDAVPSDFVFAVKASRYITHIKRLRDVGEPLALFLDRASGLGTKLGPILFQLPPTLQADVGVLHRFLEQLPAGRRWVIEFRHPSWHAPEVYQILGALAVALCIPVGGRVRPDLVTTAPFAYIRMHSGQGPGGGFTREQLKWWAARIRALGSAGKDCYVYFNNDRGGHAPRDARTLLHLIDSRETGQRGSGVSPAHNSAHRRGIPGVGAEDRG
jgi:uncharacterized protein YecE (DUF72 family)